MFSPEFVDNCKKAFKFCATIGTTLILHNIIKQSTPEDTNPAKKLVIFAGEYVLSDVLVNMISAEAEKTWNNTAQMIKDISRK